MSHMIPSGPYKIRNVLYVDRYVHMSGNKEFVGHDVAQIIQVDVKDVVQHLATLYDTETNLYLGIDQIDGKVKGFTDPQVLQLSTEDGVKFEIHPKDVDDVWYLKDGGNWTFITVQAAPASEAKYWTFGKAK
ncbi:hypothetical protein DFJ58DRAFT_841167 [Suillus subalutaceus]|uniref:uncharacterized protein n=1 Tax=Suillus subalutaceus TaxID=48586 RepID=UPI001B8763F7|nr:uncharacterized protein DFJ58DRAFT_841167 [Suillus subalutaceus]KAG1855146.1 hypothetical protein DFJ58DRAFT_841167 [Suillus subalutaceus]